MISLHKAARQALEALESADWYINQLEQIVYSDDDTDTHEERAKVQAAVTALRAALAAPNAEYERGVIDGMQRQAQSSVDRAVNRMSAAGHGMTWPGLASSSNGGNDE